jgi:hypothetical protein
VDRCDRAGGRRHPLGLLGIASMIEKMTQAGAEIIRELKGNPLVLALLLLNMVMLLGFWYSLSSVASAGERRDAMLKACIERPQ